MDPHDSDMEGSVSNNEEELSEAEMQDDDSVEALSRLPVADPGGMLAKLKQHLPPHLAHSAQLMRPPYGPPEDSPWVRAALAADNKQIQDRAEDMKPSPPSGHLASTPSPPQAQTQVTTPSPSVQPPFLPLSLFPTPAFLPPISAPPPAPVTAAPAYPTMNSSANNGGVAPPPTNNVSSASSHSSESSSSSQQTWSFEEQFKQLYEINDDPKRKEFLDDLFSFMQKRGTPINRLPIMAKSVLDLYELYNLVIARGGLVEVINKKLWQEVIKGLHLPSSITSAAFTLRTQYMKYLYHYETEKLRLSTPIELQAAIDGNRREGRRSSYGTYPDMVQPTRPGQMSPLSLVTSRPALNGNSHHQHPHMGLHPPSGPIPNLAPDFDARMVVEYVKLMNKELRSASGTPPNNRQGSNSPPSSSSPQDAALEMSRLSMWNLYNPPMPPVIPEPQKEALNLDVREQQQQRAAQDSASVKREIVVKREVEEPSATPPAKRLMLNDEDSNSLKSHGPITGTHIKIASRGDGRPGIDSSLVVSMEINGIMYQGVLFAQGTRTRIS